MILGFPGMCDQGHECSLGSGGFLSGAAVCVYLLCAVLVCATPKPKRNYMKKNETENSLDEEAGGTGTTGANRAGVEDDQPKTEERSATVY